MSDYNKVILECRLTRDPEMRYLPTGTPVCEFGVASNRVHGSGDDRKEDVLFIDVTLFGRLAEQVAGALVKGAKILLDGRLTFRQWESEEGRKRSKHGITGDAVRFLDRKAIEEA